LRTLQTIPLETRVKDKEIDGEEDVDRIQEHVVTELKEATKEEGRKDIKDEEDESFTCEEQSQQEDLRVEDKCLVGNEKSLLEKNKSEESFIGEQEESLMTGEKSWVGKRETNEDVIKEEKSLIWEEDIEKEEFHKEDDVFAIYLSDEEMEEFTGEKKMHKLQEKEMEKVPKDKKLEKQIVFKVEREAVSRVKEKPD